MTPELARWQATIEQYARDFGLDFFETRFVMVDYAMMNQLAAYGGFPTRYPHWRFGMEFERLNRSYAYGLHRIYEMVINTTPCYAYLLESNHLVDQKLVMAHVYGHVDFFKNNLWFAHTNRQMLDEMANHAGRVQRYIEKYGQDMVEDFLDICLSLDNLIDIHAPGVRRRPEQPPADDPENPQVHRLKAKDYMDSFINPPEFLAEQQRQQEANRQQMKKFPPAPERDILLFVLENALLENWQRDLLDMVREEAYYFAPQGQSKIMNEGWASFSHTYLMTRHILAPDEIIDYAEHHSGTVAVHPGRINPYKIGLELFRDIEDRWNRGAFGPDYEACDDLRVRQNWDKKVGLGRQKVFEVRRIYNDIGFIDTFLTEDFARKHKLFTYAYQRQADEYQIASRDFQQVKQKLLSQLTNFGQPLIEIVDGNYDNRGELYLVHRHDGVDLDVPYAQDTLRNLYLIWSRPVHLETQGENGKRLLFSHTPAGAKKQTI